VKSPRELRTLFKDLVSLGRTRSEHDKDRDEYRIGIDGRAFMGNPTGVGRYVIELCTRLDRLLPTAHFFVYAPSSVGLPVSSERWSARIDQSWAGRHLNRGLWLLTRAGSLCREDELDAFWGSVTLLPALEPEVRAVSTVYDLNHKIVPSTMRARDLWARRLLFGRSLARANEVLTISEATATKLRSSYGCAAVAVVRPGVSEQFAPQPGDKVEVCLGKYRLKKPYLLAVGTREPRKNFALLVEVYLQMRTEGLLGAHMLVLAGSKGWKDRRLSECLERGQSHGVTSLDYVDQDDLPPLYAGADALICPSLYEGFGMPVVEARACGIQVVASEIPELREAGGDGTIYINPNGVGIRRGLLAVTSRGGVAKTCVDRLSTWEEGAEVLADALTGGTSRDVR
jgi:glycosyltransferase involved in cell wall biosynthesis